MDIGNGIVNFAKSQSLLSSADLKFVDTKNIDITKLAKSYESLHTAMNANNLHDYCAELSKLNTEEVQLAESSLRAGVSTQQFTTALSASAKATQILKSALNGVVSALIMFAVSIAIKKLDEFIRREEIAAEKAQEARDKIDGLKKTFSDNEKTVNSLKKRYAELAQGVSNLGTAFQNQGKLSTEEYEEFLDISTQLSNIFPTLTQGYDDNGQAILGLSGNVDTIVSSLDALIERSRQIARMEIDTEMGKVWEDDLKNINDYQEKLRTVKSESTELAEGGYDVVSFGTGDLDQLERYERLLDLINHSGTKNLTIGVDIDGQDLIEIQKSLDAIHLDKKSGQYTVDGTTLFNFGRLGPENSQKLREYFAEQIKDYQSKVHQTEDKIAQIHNRMQSNLIDYLSGDTVYLALDDNSKKLANEILNNLDVSEVLNNAENNIGSWDDLTRWYQKNIIQAIADIDDKAIQGKMASILSGSVAPEDAERFYQEIIAYLQEALGADSKLVVYWKLQFEGYQDSNEEIYDKLFGNKAFQDYLTGNGSFSINNPDVQAERQRYEDWIKSLTDEEKELVLNADTRPISYALADVEAWLDKLKDKAINDAKEAASTISGSVKDFTSDIKPWIDDLGNAYTSIFYGNDGEFDIEAVNADLLEGIRSQFEAINQTFAENGIEDAFDSQALETFLGVLSRLAAEGDNSEQAVKEAQDAFNEYATSLFYSADGLKDLNEETANSIEQMMEQAGIINANEIVRERVNAQMEVQANKTQALEAATADANDTTMEATTQFLQEAEMCNLAKIQLADLVATETIFNSQTLSVDDRIEKLSALAEAYMGTAAQASFLNKVQNTAAGGHGTISAEEAWRQTVDEYSKLELAKFSPVEFKKPKPEDRGGGSGKEEEDPIIKDFEEKLQRLQWLEQNGKDIAVCYSNVA